MNDYNNLELIGGNNQKVYRAKNGYSDSVIKVLEPELHADSPHHDWNVDERIEASVNAYRTFPDLFPETEKIAENAVKQEYVNEGITFGKALQSGDYSALNEIFSNLKRVHDNGYIHGDISSDNLSTGKLSVDTETFGPGDYRHDIRKALKIAEEKNSAELFSSVISDVYGKISLN